MGGQLAQELAKSDQTKTDNMEHLPRQVTLSVVWSRFGGEPNLNCYDPIHSGSEKFLWVSFGNHPKEGSLQKPTEVPGPLLLRGDRHAALVD